MFRGLESFGLEQVGTVVHHLEVTVEWDRVDLPAVGRTEIPEEGRDVVPLERRVSLDTWCEVF